MRLPLGVHQQAFVSILGIVERKGQRCPRARGRPVIDLVSRAIVTALPTSVRASLRSTTTSQAGVNALPRALVWTFRLLRALRSTVDPTRALATTDEVA